MFDWFHTLAFGISRVAKDGALQNMRPVVNFTGGVTVTDEDGMTKVAVNAAGLTSGTTTGAPLAWLGSAWGQVTTLLDLNGLPIRNCRDHLGNQTSVPAGSSSTALYLNGASTLVFGGLLTDGHSCDVKVKVTHYPQAGGARYTDWLQLCITNVGGTLYASAPGFVAAAGLTNVPGQSGQLYHVLLGTGLEIAMVQDATARYVTAEVLRDRIQ